MARRLTSAVGSALFTLFFVVGTILFVIAGLTASLFGSRPCQVVVGGWAHYHYALARLFLGIRSKVEGIIPDGPVLFAVKHQSMFETVEVVRLCSAPVVVMKRQLADMPIFGWMARVYGSIPVDRNAGPKALREMLKLGRKAIADGRPIVIFPEGTRVAVGDTPPLRSGFAGMYRALGLPVVPIAMDSGRLWGSGLDKVPGTVTFRVGETIPAGLDRKQIEERVRDSINALEGRVEPLAP